MDVLLGIYRDTTGLFPAWKPKAWGTQGTDGGWFLLVPWGYVISATRFKRDGAKPRLPQQARQT